MNDKSAVPTLRFCFEGHMSKLRSLKGVISEVEFIAGIHAMNFSGEVWSKRLLAERLNCSKRTVERVAHDLVKAGVLSVVPGSGRTPNSYRITGVYEGRHGVKVYVHPDNPAVLVIETLAGCRFLEISNSQGDRMSLKSGRI